MLLAEGEDHRTWAVRGDDAVVVREVRDPGPDALDLLRREARLLEVAAAVLPVAVPATLAVHADPARAVQTRLTGVPLLDVPGTPPAAVAGVVGDVVGRLAAVPRGRVEGLVEQDRTGHDAWLAETADVVAALAGSLTADQRQQARRFLAAAPPPPAPVALLCHADLGTEHVLVDPVRPGRVTGVVDWSDAALTDPAHDLGLVLRDLGRAAFEGALRAYAVHVTPDEGLAARALFRARCLLLADLEFGLRTGRDAYRDKSLRAWPDLLTR